ncbi:MAG: glycosyltransferase family 2 protein [Rhodospirillales bacterium]|nr:glycosyltransferase family 2 protein [Alphaproteobacteria bacterium]MCB1840294.1 glycosyltransferase family 2 protein [Alphaproteobacteria bacterium]MCB9976867.1 glycosyltransferase family 2 protein [Rhodospirillales bacterium]
MISVIIPVHNERDNIEPLLREIQQASADAPISEVIYIDDSSTDDTLNILKKQKENFPFLRVIRHSVRSGQSAAFMTGARAAGNGILVFMDGDGQNDPKDIAKLFAAYESSDKDKSKIMIAGQRQKRQDNAVRRISSRLANKIRSSLLKDKTRDTGCSLKMINRENYVRLPFFNHMHRFLPALLIRDHVEIIHVDVSHRPRQAGTSKYGFWNRFWVGILDLLGVKWLMMRGLPVNYSSHELLESTETEKVIPYERRNNLG